MNLLLNLRKINNKLKFIKVYLYITKVSYIKEAQRNIYYKLLAKLAFYS